MKAKVFVFASALALAAPLMPHVVMAQGAGDAATVYSDEDTAFLNRFVGDAALPSQPLPGEIVVGSQLPPTMTYRNIEGHPRFQGMRYAHVNNRHVVVDRNGRVMYVHTMKR